MSVEAARAQGLYLLAEQNWSSLSTPDMSNYVVHRARLKYYRKIRNIKYVQIKKNVQLCEQIEQVAAWRAESASQMEVLNRAGKISCVCHWFSGAVLAGGEAGQAHPASSCPPQLLWGPVYSLQPVTHPDQFVQFVGVRVDLNSMFCVIWVVCIADKSWEREHKAVVFTAVQCAAIFGERLRPRWELTVVRLWDSNVHQRKYAGGFGQISIGKRYKFILILNRRLNVLLHLLINWSPEQSSIISKQQRGLSH